MPALAGVQAQTRSTLPQRAMRSIIPVALSIAAMLLASGCSQQANAPMGVAQQALDARVEMQVSAASIGSGGGVLLYRGRQYPFIVAGLGVGGIGGSLMIDVDGDVYHMPDPAAFPGAYAQSPAFGRSGGGDLWLQNHDNVLLHLVAKRQGLMLSVGGDIVAITTSH